MYEIFKIDKIIKCEKIIHKLQKQMFYKEMYDPTHRFYEWGVRHLHPVSPPGPEFVITTRE